MRLTRVNRWPGPWRPFADAGLEKCLDAVRYEIDGAELTTGIARDLAGR
jgi:hypothetical protein